MAVVISVALLTGGTFLVCVVVHLAAIFFDRGVSMPAAVRAAYAGVLGAGPVLVWFLSAGVTSGVAGVERDALRAAAVLLYLAAAIAYAELRSLVFRGYSLRILVDLLERPEGATVEELDRGYGAGMGVRGMLEKRVAGLAALGLLRREDGFIGPLTPGGNVLAGLAYAMRRLLRLEAGR